MSLIQTVPGLDLSGLGLPKIVSPVPLFVDKLKAAYLFGSDWDGAGSALDDYSGNGYNLISGDQVVGTNYIEGGSVYPRTPFSVNDLLDGGSTCTVITVANVTSSAVITPLVQASGSTPYIAIHARPSADGVRGFVVDGTGTSQADHTYGASGMEGIYATYHCRWDATHIIPGVVKPADGVVAYTSTVSARAPSGASGFNLMATASTPHTRMAALAFYKGSLSDVELAQVYSALKATLATVSHTI